LTTLLHKIRVGRNVLQLSQPRFGIVRQRLQDYAFANAANADLVAFEAELPRQPNGLAAAVFERAWRIGS